MKAYVEISKITETFLTFSKTDLCNEIIQSINGNTKEDGFKAALFVLPSVILANCDPVYVPVESKDDPQ